MNTHCHLTPINLSDINELDSLVEHRRIFHVKDCQLNIFETYHKSENVALSFDGLVLSSMMRGKKIMSLDRMEPFSFIPGQSVILPQGVSMQVDFPEADTQHPVQCATLALDWDMVNRNIEFLNNHYPNPAAPYEWKLDFKRYHFQNNPELTMCMNRLISISMEDHTAKDALADLTLKFLLLRIIQTQQLALAQESKSLQGLPFAPVLEYIQEYLDQTITVEQLAQVAGMSKTRFFQSFKSYFGQTPIRYILEKRIAQAKKLLANPELSVSEVSYRSGFNNVHYFIRQFKRMEGLTPKQYR